MLRQEALCGALCHAWVLTITCLQNFWRFLLRKALPKDALSALRFAVFGLGDSAYTKFNAVARKLHARLAQLGASPLVARGLGDEQSPQGIDGDLDDWLPGLWDALLTVYPLPAGYTVSDKPELDPPKYAVTTQPGPPPQTPASDRWLSSFYRAPRGVRGDATRGPLHARVLHNRRVTAPDWSQDVRHVVLALPAGGPSYRAGDVAHVYPENGVDVQAWCAELGLDADAVVRGIPWLRYPATVAQLLRRHLDVLGIPRRSFFEQLAFFATDDDERDKLFELATAEAAPLRQEYASREKRTYLEVMGEFPSARPPLEHVLSLIPPLQPRQFSIASADAARPGYVELCAAVVDYKTPFGRRKRVRQLARTSQHTLTHTTCWSRRPHPLLTVQGVCTDWFTTLDAGRGDTVPLWVAEGALRAPEDPSTPLLLIGPGTGIAPFRAIVHERAAMVAPDCAVGQGPPTPSPDGSTWRPQRALDDAQRAQLGKTIVFFGCRCVAGPVGGVGTTQPSVLAPVSPSPLALVPAPPCPTGVRPRTTTTAGSGRRRRRRARWRGWPPPSRATRRASATCSTASGRRGRRWWP